MKSITLIISFFWISSLFASALKWSEQNENQIFKLTQSIKINIFNDKFEEVEHVISKDSKFELIEVSNLNMIKVHLHKYKISNCPSLINETELELVKIKQPSGSDKIKSVGVNLTKNCILEVFIDMEDYNSYSFLK